MNINAILKAILKALVFNGPFIAAGYYIHHNAVPGDMRWTIAGIAVTVIWAVRVAFRLNRSYKKIKQKTGGTVSLKNIDQVGAATLPDWMLGYYETEKKIYKHAWRALTLARIPGNEGFATRVPVLNGVRSAVLSLLVAAGGAWGASTLYAGLGHGAGATTAALVVAALSLYTLAWIVGDWRACREVRHRIGDDALWLAVGIRASVAIPFSAIAGCSVLRDAAASAGTARTTGKLGAADAAKKADAADATAGGTLRMTASASANVLLELLSPQELTVTRFGYPIPATVAVIALDLVQPQAFADALAQKMNTVTLPLSA